MSSPLDDFTTAIQAEIAATITHYQALAKDGLTIDEIWELANSALASFTHIVELAGTLNNISGPDKKAAVMAAAAKFYDTVIAPIALTGNPIIERTLIDPLLKQVFLKLASGAIDSLVAIFSRVNWGNGPVTPPVVPPLTPPVTPPVTPPSWFPY